MTANNIIQAPLSAQRFSAKMELTVEKYMAKTKNNNSNEEPIEKFVIELLEKQGYQYIFAPSIAPNRSACDTPTRKIQ